ncbi:unnamed protein product [Paramecium sonneborni]|uniref:Trafficking protein particle complex subunit n=1 Tax=Paramecium sonneborni TaxID=65129 RepID=A0A8S1P1H9_9CILI|nr:unnamed protein product [Paramecium sonneborni]
MDQSPTQKIQLPKSNQYKRQSTIEYPIVYHLLSTYMFTVQQNTKLNKNEKQIRLIEMGKKLGQNVMESLASTQFEKIRLNPDQGKYTEYVKFFGKDFWSYMFGQPVSKVQINKSGSHYDIEDKYEEQKKGNNTITKLGFQMTRRIRLNDKIQQDEYLTLWASLIQGLVIGGMKALTIDCDSEVEFINNEPSDLRFTIQIRDFLSSRSNFLI